MQQFSYLLKPVRLAMLREGPTAEEAALVQEHFLYLENLVAEGVVLMAGRTLTTDERTFGIAILQAKSEAHAAELMDNDPAVKQKLMLAELFPFRVALWSPLGPGGDAH